MDYPIKHGTARGYRRGCRCDECRGANAEKTRRARQRRKANGVQPPKHGTQGYSNYDCRCEVCTKAWSEYCSQNGAKWYHNQTGSGTPPLHGRKGWELYGCRCEVCASGYRKGLTEKKTRNDESRDVAHRNGQPWTGPELELLARTDLTIAEIARQIGRTISAVHIQRVRLQREPSKQWLAGQRPTRGDA